MHFFTSIFFLSVFLILYTQMGYPLLLRLIIAWRGKKQVKKEAITPSVTLLIPAHNEAKVIGEKIENSLNLDYPKEKLQILVASDGSTDETNDIVRSYAEQGVALSINSGIRGKISAINNAVPEAKGEIIVFSDAAEMYKLDALKQLVKNYADPEVGCVTGETRTVYKSDTSVGESVSSYWKYEYYLKQLECAASGTTLGAAGTIYSVRKELYPYPPHYIIADDLVIPLKVIEQGYRVISDPEAIAIERVNQAQIEFGRRVRNIAANYQALSYLDGFLNPFKRGLVSIEYISHKFFRVLLPFFVLAVLISNLFLLHILLFKILFICQIIFYLSGAFGWLFQGLGKKIKIFQFPYFFCVANLAALVGFFKYLFGTQKTAWKGS